MKIEIPRLVRPIRLADYAPELGEAAINVWVNPPRAFLRKLEELRARLAAEPTDATLTEWYGWIAEAWSQGPADSHWTDEEVRTLAEHSFETDPALMAHLVSTTVHMIAEHRETARKN